MPSTLAVESYRSLHALVVSLAPLTVVSGAGKSNLYGALRLLLDLTGRLLTRLGASTAMHSEPRPKAQRWSRALYDAYPGIHGILYCSSMYGNAPAVALYERAINALPAEPQVHRLLDDPAFPRTVRIAAAECGYQVTSAPVERPRSAPDR